MLLFERERGTLLFDVVFLGADLRLRRRGDEEAQRVKERLLPGMRL